MLSRDVRNASELLSKLKVSIAMSGKVDGKSLEELKRLLEDSKVNRQDRTEIMDNISTELGKLHNEPYLNGSSPDACRKELCSKAWTLCTQSYFKVNELTEVDCLRVLQAQLEKFYSRGKVGFLSYKDHTYWPWKDALSLAYSAIDFGGKNISDVKGESIQRVQKALEKFPLPKGSYGAFGEDYSVAALYVALKKQSLNDETLVRESFKTVCLSGNEFLVRLFLTEKVVNNPKDIASFKESSKFKHLVKREDLLSDLFVQMCSQGRAPVMKLMLSMFVEHISDESLCKGFDIVVEKGFPIAISELISTALRFREGAAAREEIEKFSLNKVEDGGSAFMIRASFNFTDAAKGGKFKFNKIVERAKGSGKNVVRLNNRASTNNNISSIFNGVFDQSFFVKFGMEACKSVLVTFLKAVVNNAEKESAEEVYYLISMFASNENVRRAFKDDAFVSLIFSSVSEVFLRVGNSRDDLPGFFRDRFSPLCQIEVSSKVCEEFEKYEKQFDQSSMVGFWLFMKIGQRPKDFDLRSTYLLICGDNEYAANLPLDKVSKKDLEKGLFRACTAGADMVVGRLVRERGGDLSEVLLEAFWLAVINGKLNVLQVLHKYNKELVSVAVQTDLKSESPKLFNHVLSNPRLLQFVVQNCDENVRGALFGSLSKQGKITNLVELALKQGGCDSLLSFVVSSVAFKNTSDVVEVFSELMKFKKFDLAYEFAGRCLFVKGAKSFDKTGINDYLVPRYVEFVGSSDTGAIGEMTEKFEVKQEYLFSLVGVKDVKSWPYQSVLQKVQVAGKGKPGFVGLLKILLEKAEDLFLRGGELNIEDLACVLVQKQCSLCDIQRVKELEEKGNVQPAGLMKLRSFYDQLRGKFCEEAIKQNGGNTAKNTSQASYSRYGNKKPKDLDERFDHDVTLGFYSGAEKAILKSGDIVSSCNYALKLLAQAGTSHSWAALDYACIGVVAAGSDLQKKYEILKNFCEISGLSQGLNFWSLVRQILTQNGQISPADIKHQDLMYMKNALSGLKLLENGPGDLLKKMRYEELAIMHIAFGRKDGLNDSISGICEANDSKLLQWLIGEFASASGVIDKEMIKKEFIHACEREYKYTAEVLVKYFGKYLADENTLKEGFLQVCLCGKERLDEWGGFFKEYKNVVDFTSICQQVTNAEAVKAVLEEYGLQVDDQAIQEGFVAACRSGNVPVLKIIAQMKDSVLDAETLNRSLRQASNDEVRGFVDSIQKKKDPMAADVVVTDSKRLDPKELNVGMQ